MTARRPAWRKRPFRRLQTPQVEHKTAPPAERETARGHSVGLDDVHAFYGDTHAVRGVSLNFEANRVTAMIGPSGCGKSTLVRCINRMHEEIPGARATGKITLDDLDLYDDSIDVVSVRRSVGMVFQKPNPFPDDVDLRQRRRGAAADRPARRDQRARREVAARRGAVGRGQGPPRRARHRALRRPAAAALHRAHDRGRARGDPDGRAVLRPRPARHAADRGADRGPQAPLHDRHRHPQHAAGRARGRRDGVHAQRRARRVRADRAHLHLAAATRGRRSTSRASSV